MKLGIAYDLGSTTVVGYLCDLNAGRIVGSLTVNNPQIEYGLDILSRASFAAESSDNKRLLAEALGKSIEKVKNMLLAEADCVTASIDKVVLVGNPVIMGSIARYSFDKDEQLKDADIVKLFGIGDYVGADALAASYMVYLDRKELNCLMIDIGTNTEMVLMTNEGVWATSAAAGPALEGGNISCGMRGEDGAIDKCSLTNGVNVNSDIAFHVINNTMGHEDAKGLCGSGLLSLIQCLKEAGIIDSTGYLLGKEEAIRNRVPIKLASRIAEGNGSSKGSYVKKCDDKKCDDKKYDDKEFDEKKYDGVSIINTIPKMTSDNSKSTRYFKLTDKVSVSQEDIRNVQLAIAAIRTGIDILEEKAWPSSGGEADKIDRIYLAGTFGNSLSTDSILKSGMINSIYKDRLYKAGNLAGIGACKILMDNNIMPELTTYRNSAITVALAKEADFQERYISNL